MDREDEPRKRNQPSPFGDWQNFPTAQIVAKNEQEEEAAFASSNWSPDISGSKR